VAKRAEPDEEAAGGAASKKGFIVPPDLAKRFTELTALRDKIDIWEADLAAAKARLLQLSQDEIPELMLDKYDSPVTEWIDPSGRRWNFDCDALTVSGSLPSKDAQRKAAAIEWLEQNEGGDLIKTDVSLSFSREQRDEAIKIAKRLEKSGFAPNVNSGVHAQTLCAWARERLRQGEPVDGDVLGLYIGRKTKFKVVQLPVQTKAATQRG
jgi:hypothetical protein